MVVVPGFVICMIPPYAHISFDVLFNAGFPPISTVGLPGAQGAVITGMHGIGVSTPRAAAVADATCGLARELHIPNGITFFIGTLSIIVAIGVVVIVLFSGVTINVDGAIPKEHAHIAPAHTHIPIELPPDGYALPAIILSIIVSIFVPLSTSLITFSTTPRFVMVKNRDSQKAPSSTRLSMVLAKV